MTVTMRQVAAALGVSVTTVSKVLNNRGDIGEEMRARVLAKVDELGYRPNAVARSLTLRRTHTLGVIVADLMHSFFVEIVTSIEEYIRPRGYGLLLCNVGEDPDRERGQLEMLLERQVDGIILASVDARRSDALLRRFIAGGKGLVLIDRDDHPELACHRILTDDEMVGRLATEHLVSLGHRRVAHLQGPPLVHAIRRADGYRAVMRAHGLAGAGDWIVPAGFLERDGYRAMTDLLKAAPDVTAVFAANDSAAMGAMRAVWESGRRVPQDVSIVGAGDVAHGDMLKVPLTTVSWSRTALGVGAARLILDQIEHHPTGPFARVVVPPVLVPRESSGPPRTA
jgi:LacI family transcriptional regulator